MNKIQKVGGIQKLDSNGFIINNFDLKNIQKEYLCILNDVKDLYLKLYGDLIHSIYIRGSVLKAQAVKNISDIDTIAICNKALTKEEKDKRKILQKTIANKYDYLNGVEVFFIEKQEVENSKRLQFLLKTQSKCVYGNDIREKLPSFGIEKCAYAHSKYLEQDIYIVKSDLNENLNEKQIKNICSWIMKRIVRVGFEIVMKKEKYFTRDLYFCYEAFVKYHLNKEKQMYKALELAVFPVANKKEIIETINLIERHLIEAVKYI